MPRTIQPELLDSLSPQDPAALHSRRDLRLINRLMGNHRWFLGQLPKRINPGERVLEIGSGTGELAAQLHQAGVPTAGLDLMSAPDSWPTSQPWHADDLRTFDQYTEYSVIIGNLVFHHLTDVELKHLGVRLQRGTRLILACEPARRRVCQFFFRLLALALGASHVTLHDGHVSIAGGFAGDELAHALGLDKKEWSIEQGSGLLGGYRMIATRRA